MKCCMQSKARRSKSRQPAACLMNEVSLFFFFAIKIIFS